MFYFHNLSDIVFYLIFPKENLLHNKASKDKKNPKRKNNCQAVVSCWENADTVFNQKPPKRAPNPAPVFTKATKAK